MNKNRAWGIRTEGLEVELENIISNHVRNKEEYIFLEIGVATAVTHRAIRDIISENIKTHSWLTIGLDLIGSADVNFAKINQIFKPEELLINNSGNDEKFLESFATEKYNSVLVLREDPRAWVDNISPDSLDLVIIDACHGSKCVMNDFKAIEKKVKSGGIVMFHDSGVEETGTDWQGHCGEYINVRGALDKLGLINEVRAGWKLIKEVSGTRKLNKDENGGNSMAIFEKL
jgi:hypothetical protein